MFKKALAAILALVMVIGLLPVLPASTTAFAQIFGECGDHLSWTFEDGTLYITGNGNMYNYNGGNPAPWYEQRENIKNVIFTDGGGQITSIGDFAFDGCVNLTDLTIRSSSSIYIIGDFAFNGCESLKDFFLPNGVEKIGYYAFAGCESLTAVPARYNLRNLKTLGSGAFQYCTGIKEAVYPPQLKKIPSNLYYGCTGLTELIIPETVSCIGSNAFGSCSSLERVVLNTGVTELEESAFSECSSLSKVFVSNALKMDSDVFYKCPEDIEFYFDHSQSYFETYSDIDSYNADFTDAEHFYQELTTVILNPNEGVGGVFGETSRPYAIEKKTGEPFIVSGESEYIPVVNGEKFMGWNAMPDGSGITYMPGDEYTGITTLNLYAQWNSSEILRLSGSTRNGTAVAISEWLNDYVVECDAVVLANGWDFADALAGGPLAKSLGATILLITGDESDEATFDEIERIGAKDIYILGGTVAVSEDVEERLEGDHNVIRIAGSNRFETAVKIAEEIEKHFAETCGNAFFAYSHNYPDALAVSGIAAIDGAPILYIGSDGVLDSATAAYVKKCKFKNAYVLGGTGAIDAAAEGNIKKAGAKHVDRIAGATRYETCLEINKAFSYLFGDGTTAYAMCVSTGTNFPDALAGSVLAAWYNSPMLLVAPDEPLSAAQKKYADDTLDKEYSCIIIFGGKGAVPEAIENELKGLIGLD